MIDSLEVHDLVEVWFTMNTLGYDKVIGLNFYNYEFSVVDRPLSIVSLSFH